ncbi:MAG: biotin--[acetyl-CoA-carboxylase] ligase [Thermodesulfobacteriota bacterium]|nr:biotin--[acetyl-CoA-carboxylase] ligase [Thermodesulfobacteriota bacterium]
MEPVNRGEEVLILLKDTDGFISGEKIASELKISRTAVWKQISRLRKEGFQIEAHPRLGYSLVFSPDRLLPSEIRNGIKASLIGSEISYYEKIESTNAIAKNLAMNGAEEGTLVIAEEQTKGRGRLNRDWLSPAYSNILMSLIFRPNLQAAKAFSMIMLTSVAIVRAIQGTTSLVAQIKWPNDIYLHNKKLGGILTEFNAEQDRVNFIVVGVGLNVNFDPCLYPEIKDTATSLKKVLGKEVKRAVLLRSILEEIERGYSAFNKGCISQIRCEWDNHSLVTGKHVRIHSLDNVEEGVAESIDDDGYLILRDINGNTKRILSGDVSLRVRE